MKKILYAEGDAIDVGGGVATAANEGAGDGDKAAGGAEFDWATPLPGNLPDNLSSLKGKTFKDWADSSGNLRTKMNEQGNQIADLTKANEELQVGLKQAQDQNRAPDDPAVKAAQQEQLRQMAERYDAASQEYILNGEVSEEFLEAVDGQPVRVTRDTMLDFFEYQKFKHENMVEKLSHHADRADVTPEVTADIILWLKSGESPFDVDVRKGFDSMYKAENLSWFDTVLEKYDATFGDGQMHGDQRMQNRHQQNARKIRGRPVVTKDQRGFANAREFQEALIANRADRTITTRQRNAKEAELIAQRDAQHSRRT